MAKKTKKANWLYIALGAVVGVGAVMGVSRLLTNDRSNLGTTLTDTRMESNVEGYELMLAYDDADKILDICHSAMEDSNIRAVEIGYSYAIESNYAFVDENGDVEKAHEGPDIVLCYDYAENADDGVLIVYLYNGAGNIGKTLFKVDQSGISGEGYVFGTDEEPGMVLNNINVCGYKMALGERDCYKDVSELYSEDILPDEIINLVRLVER